jgi:hypothetical protein
VGSRFALGWIGGNGAVGGETRAGTGFRF